MLKLITKETKHIIKYMGAEFDIVPLTKEENKEILDNHSYYKKIEKNKTTKPEYEERIDMLEVTIEKIDRQVTGWRGLEGNPECTSVNKRELVIRKENEHILTHIQTEIERIGESQEEKKKEKIKN